MKVFRSNAPLGSPGRLAILSYAIAFLSIAIAAIAAQLAVVFLHTEPFVSLFLCAIVVAAWFGGRGPGLFAAAFALLIFDYYLVPPSDSFLVPVTEVPRVALFAITALFVAAVTAATAAWDIGEPPTTTTSGLLATAARVTSA
jgi:K+-sensing histidine kinase KdpD